MLDYVAVAVGVCFCAAAGDSPSPAPSKNKHQVLALVPRRLAVTFPNSKQRAMREGLAYALVFERPHQKTNPTKKTARWWLCVAPDETFDHNGLIFSDSRQGDRKTRDHV